MMKSKIVKKTSFVVGIIFSSVISLLFTACSEAQMSHTKIDGIDVSHHQGDIRWEKVASHLRNDSFVYIKCTEGSTCVDSRCKYNAINAKKHGLKIGGYHYFRMTSSAYSQFRNFKKILDQIEPDLIPMVDVETSDKCSVRELQDSLRVILDLLEKEYGKKPMIYGTNGSYNTYCAPVFNSYPLYIGRYSNKVPVVNGPSHYTIWQYSESGNINGIKKHVDLCTFHKTKGINDILL